MIPLCHLPAKTLASQVRKNGQRTEVVIDFGRGNLEKIDDNALEARLHLGKGATLIRQRLDKITDFGDLQSSCKRK